MIYYYYNWDYTAVRDAIQYAIAHNVVVVASAGNNNGILPNEQIPCEDVPYPCYPAQYPDVIAVSASQYNGNFVDGWNYGDFVSVNAPGRTDAYSGLWSTDLNNSYTNDIAKTSGTSFSAPQVAALAALIKSINATITPEQIKTILQNTADKIGQYFYEDDIRNLFFGYGRINTYKALKYTLENFGGALTQNLTIPAGETWNFQPDITLSFQNGASLIVEGTLIANGYLGRITIDFIAKNNNGITVNSGGTANISYTDISNAIYGVNFNQGSGTIDNCTITDCNYGIKISSATPTIQNCTISDNQYGIHVTSSYSQSWTSNNFYNNTITDNTSYGIYLYNSSPTLSYNTITGNNNGTTLWYSSNPTLDHNYLNSNTNYGFACYGSACPNVYTNPTYSFGGHNTVESNGNKGIVITYNSNPILGYLQTTRNGNNSIYGNTGYEVDNTSSNTILACGNYWEYSNGPQTGDINGSVTTSGYLSSDPNPLSKASSEISFEYDSTINIPSTLQNAYYKMVYDDYEGAATILKNYLLNEKSSGFEEMAAVMLLKDMDFYLDNKSIISEAEELLSSSANSTVSFELLSGISLLYQKEKDTDAALNCIEKLSGYAKTTEQANRILFLKAFYYMYSLQDAEKGKLYLNEIISNNKEGIVDYQVALEELNSLLSIDKTKQESNEEIKTSSAELEVPDTYELIGNYPNPFNPTTTIKYALPAHSNVMLKIYDLMGREIRTLVYGNDTEGYKEIIWDGKNNSGNQVASGIYLYRLIAKSLEDGKVFEKSSKMMLIK